MQCERAQEQLFDYIDGALTPALQQVLEHHLDSCAPCKTQLGELRGVYALLDEGLPEVDVPPGFRASVLSAVSEQPKPLSLAARVQQWILPSASAGRVPVFGASAAALLCIVGVGSYIANRHAGGEQTVSPVIQGSIASPWRTSALSIQNDGILQSVRSYAQSGQEFHIFGLHLPAKDAAAVSVQSYIVQSESVLTDQSNLQNPADATPAPTIELSPGASYEVPVAVPANVPAGKSMTYMAQWIDSNGPHNEVCFVPLGMQPSPVPVTVSQGESLFDALATVSAAYGSTIIVGDTATGALTQPISRGLDGSDASVSDALADLVLPANHSFTRQNDGSFVIR